MSQALKTYTKGAPFYNVWMCVNIFAMDGLPSIALASSPAFGKARSRLTRMVLFRSQESSRVSSRRWSVASDICTPIQFLTTG
jgi:hypothetical protein